MLSRFFKISIFLVKICILIWYFWVIFENYSMHMLSIRGNDFIAHWTYEEMISSHTEHTIFMHAHCSASGKMWTFFTCTSMLSIRGTNFIAHWAYVEWISSLAEHTRKYLKVEYLSRIEYNFQKSCVQALGTIRFRFLQKSKKKISCLCTFNYV